MHGCDETNLDVDICSPQQLSSCFLAAIFNKPSFEKACLFGFLSLLSTRINFHSRLITQPAEHHAFHTSYRRGHSRH